MKLTITNQAIAASHKAGQCEKTYDDEYPERTQFQSCLEYWEEDTASWCEGCSSVIEVRIEACSSPNVSQPNQGSQP